MYDYNRLYELDLSDSQLPDVEVKEVLSELERAEKKEHERKKKGFKHGHFRGGMF